MENGRSCPLTQNENPSTHKRQSSYFPAISLWQGDGKVLYEQYRKQVLPNLSNSQFAYCAGVGTTDAIIYTIEHWTKMLDDRGIKAVEVLFKDFSKAFDSLQPAQLLKSLVEMGVTSDILKLSMDFMTNRQQRVRIKDASSPYLPITVGVPQGTLAGPMFWLAFINSYNPPQSQCNTMYADDITCTIPVSCSIDDNIQPVVEWGISWNTEHKMALTRDKTNLCS